MGRIWDVPMNPETECIEEDWHIFKAGTHREDIWHWFEDTYNVRVYDNTLRKEVVINLNGL